MHTTVPCWYRASRQNSAHHERSDSRAGKTAKGEKETNGHPKRSSRLTLSQQFPASESKQQRLRKHTAAAQERSHGIIAHNANLLWQHEAAAADQGSAGGPLTTPLGPLGSVRQQFGQPEQHLLSRAACRLSQRCCCASEWMSKNGERCNVRLKSATRSLWCASHADWISTYCCPPPTQRKAGHAMRLLPECSYHSAPLQTRSPFGCSPEHLQTYT